MPFYVFPVGGFPQLSGSTLGFGFDFCHDDHSFFLNVFILADIDKNIKKLYEIESGSIRTSATKKAPSHPVSDAMALCN